MSSQAQVLANYANAQHSTGPMTEAGKAVSSRNNLRHGLAGGFSVLSWEKQEEFDELLASLRDEHIPHTVTEHLLVEKMAAHLWLSRRALLMQDMTVNAQLPTCDDTKQLALFLRYQITHDRAFHTALGNLLKLRAEKRKEQIGFESQERQRSNERRKQEMHEARLRGIEAQTREREIDSEIRQTIEAPLPGHMRIPFDTLKGAFDLAVHEVSRKLAAGASAA